MVLNLIFLGPPGTGKGTVSQAAEKKYGAVQISTGDLCREKAKEDSEEGRKIKAVLAGAGLVDDKTILGFFKERIPKPDVKKGFILDGFPRNLAQAEALDKLLEGMGKKLSLVINIESSEEKVVERICHRLTCPVCNRIYNEVSVGMIPKVPGKCDDDGATLVKRGHDTEEVVRARFQVFLKETAPLIDYYKKKGILKSYDGNPPMEESVRRAFEIIDDYLAKGTEKQKK